MEQAKEIRDIEQLIVDRLPKSAEILERAKKVLLSPTVTGPYRAPRGVAFIKEAKGSKVIDVDGNEYVDLTMAGKLPTRQRISNVLESLLLKHYDCGWLICTECPPYINQKSS